MSDIPTINLQHLDDPNTQQALDHACRHWGCFQVVEHGIREQVIDDLRWQMHRLFGLPRAEKQQLYRTADNPWGFYDRELTKNTRDWKQIFDVGPANGASQRPRWPEVLPGFQPAVETYHRACEDLALRLLQVIARNLEVESSELVSCFVGDHSSFLRLNYYPICPLPARPQGCEVPSQGYLGVNHHTDAGALTLLLQDNEPGLEIYRAGHWQLVPPQHGALVVNIGDLLQVWSNDRYPASLHRVVVNAERERFSVPFFFNPAYQTLCQPLSSTVDVAHPPRYRPVNWGEYRSARMAGDYADQGEEIQISHYRLPEIPETSPAMSETAL